MDLNKLFETLPDLVGIEKERIEQTDDNGNHLWFNDYYLLHLEANFFRPKRFLMVDPDDLEIVGEGKDSFFGRSIRYAIDFKLFNKTELNYYEKKLFQLVYGGEQ